MSNSMEILLKSNGGRMGLGTAGFPHVSLFFHTSSSLASLHSFSVFLFLPASPSFLAGSVFSFCFLPVCCLAKPFFSLPDSAFFCSSFLLCAAFPHFRSLSANSRCLIHQHLLKLLAVLCTSVALCMCETVCVFECACAGKLEKVCEIMCMHVTVSSSHLWHTASPHASVRKKHR